MSRFDNDNRDHRDDLELAVAEVLSEPLDDRQVEEAAARVWRKLAAATPEGIATIDATAATPATPATAAPADQPIPGCGDFGHLVPAYLDGSLAPARALLFEDHSRDCLPCRR
ncbi:MAG TPA: zf-HC2 domain-containing protein, partial [Thermoanaerobaculia bacterium]|nr:zf-HC2 domain-containing protein [Thermoanaerobaculia bacterium]